MDSGTYKISSATIDIIFSKVAMYSIVLVFSVKKCIIKGLIENTNPSKQRIIPPTKIYYLGTNSIKCGYVMKFLKGIVAPKAKSTAG